jgi:fructuronate reductase
MGALDGFMTPVTMVQMADISSAAGTDAHRLSRATLSRVPQSISRPAYVPQDTAIGIVHFGPGVFHRVHQAFYVDAVLSGDPRWAISAVSLRSNDLREALAPQDWLYTLTTFGERTALRVIGALKEVLVAPQARESVLARLAARQTRVVTITVTEKGYCLTRDGELDTARPEIQRDMASPDSPSGLIGWLVLGQRVRREAGLAPLTVLSCDNLLDNGIRLKRAVVQFARERDPGLADWIESEAPFPRTMVDSIAPATDQALRDHVRGALGLEDAWPVQREEFTQWVIEKVPGAAGPEWERAGVTLSANITAYDRAKLRLLNGAHSSLAYLGSLAGYETIGEAMKDAPLRAFVRSLMLEDIAPTLEPSPEIDLQAYGDAILARFRNPAIRHTVAQIAWDGSQKLPLRLIGTISDALAAGRRLDRLAVPVAAWMRFLVKTSREGAAIVDPLAGELGQIAKACTGKAASDVPRFLALDAVFPRKLAVNTRFVEAVSRAYDMLAQHGLGALDRLAAEPMQ